MAGEIRNKRLYPVHVTPDGRILDAATGVELRFPGLTPAEVLRRIAELDAEPGELLEDVLAELVKEDGDP